MQLDDILSPVQRFIAWTNRKIAIHFEDRPEFYFYEREVWWASLGENVGSETKIGHLSPEQFQPLLAAFVALIKTNSST